MFDDLATQLGDDMCNATPSAIAGLVRPSTPLDTFLF